MNLEQLARETANEVRKTVQESTIADTYSLHDDVVAVILSALSKAVKEKDERIRDLSAVVRHLEKYGNKRIPRPATLSRPPKE